MQHALHVFTVKSHRLMSRSPPMSLIDRAEVPQGSSPRGPGPAHAGQPLPLVEQQLREWREALRGGAGGRAGGGPGHGGEPQAGAVDAAGG